METLQLGSQLARFAAPLVFAAFLPCPAAAQGLAQQEWIDVHVHLVAGRAPAADYPGAVRAAVEAMNQVGIRMSVVLPPPQVAGMATFDWREFSAALKAYPGKFAFLGGGGSLNVLLHQPASAANTDARLREEFERTAEDILASGASGFGEIAAHHLSHMQGHPYEWIAPDHPLLLRLADIAARRGSLIDLHIDIVPRDMKAPPRFLGLNPQVLRQNLSGFERLLAHNREAKIVWAHAGSDPLGNFTPELAREMLQKHPNLYMSLRIPPRIEQTVPPGMEPGAMKGPAAKKGPGAMKSSGSVMGPPGPRAALILNAQDEINPGWLEVLKEFPDRFVIGGDQFFASPNLRGQGPGITFASKAPSVRERTRRFLSQLPPELARRIGIDNAVRLYRLAPPS